MRAPARVQMPRMASIAAQTPPAVAELPPIALALNAPKTSAPSLDSGTNEVVVANTPSGAGDPDAIVCRAPQRLAGSGQLGPQICLHNHEWWKVAINGKDVAADGESLIDKPTVANPRGEGDPGAVTCRTPKAVSSGQDWVKRYGPEVCRTNRFWADIIKNRQIVNAQGEVVPVPRDLGYGDFFWGGGYQGLSGFGFNANGPGDSGHASQSSEPHPGGTLPGSAPVISFPGYSPPGSGGGGGGGGGTPTMGGYHP